MNRKIILDQMGVVQWRLRDPLTKTSEITHHAQSNVTRDVNQAPSETNANLDSTLVTENEIELEPSASTQGEPSARIQPEPSATLKPEPSARIQPEPSATLQPEPSANSRQAIDPSLEKPSPEKLSPEKTAQQAQEYDWPSLIELLNDKRHCDSCSQVTPIIGDGDITADWLFVFDSPTARDIEQQALLSGRVGQLFDAILVALQLDRPSVYLSSIFKCPPAANISDSAPLCDDLLAHQIKLINPKVIIAFGEFTSQAMVKSNENLEQLRSQAHNHASHPVRVIPTYSLMQMLDTPLLKAQVWDDLKNARQLLES